MGSDVAAGDRAEACGISIVQRAGPGVLSQQRQRSASLRPEVRGGAPLLRGAKRPGFVGHVAPAASLQAAGQPLARRGRRLRDRLGRVLVGSGMVHLVTLVLLAVGFARHENGAPPEPVPVEMMYDHTGSSSATGQPNNTDSTQTSNSGQATPQPKPQNQAMLEAPSQQTLPQPAPEPAPAPVPLPTPRPSRQHRVQPPSDSPLSHPMDLSFGGPPSPQPSRHRHGAGGPIDLSLGPLVRNGQILTPYASATRITGVSSDYAAEIDSWIRRHMYYPEDAAHRGEDGPSSVHVVLDREGRVKTIQLVTSSGSYALDDATQGMFRGAVLPPVPPDMAGKNFDINLTIDYILVRR